MPHLDGGIYIVNSGDVHYRTKYKDSKGAVRSLEWCIAIARSAPIISFTTGLYMLDDTLGLAVHQLSESYLDNRSRMNNMGSFDVTMDNGTAFFSSVLESVIRVNKEGAVPISSELLKVNGFTRLQQSHTIVAVDESRDRLLLVFRQGVVSAVLSSVR